MQHHKKTYENLFSTDRPKSTARLNINEISAGEMNLDEYVSLLHSFLTDFYINLFDNSVKLSWLRRKFTYYGKKTVFPMSNNSPNINIAFVKFLRREVGKDIQIITKGKFFSKLELFFDEIFPGFMEGNPFENPDYYKFPFENISIDFFLVVWQLQDRLELLRFADKEKMSYAVFVDYIINYIMSENEIIDRQRYQIKYGIGTRFPFYIRDVDMDLKVKKKIK